MRLSTDRILTTHVGSLPRPDDLVALLYAKDNGEPYDEAALAAGVRRAVDDVVDQQVEAGIDVVSDGEMAKIGYSTYLKDRLTGFGGEGGRRVPKDLQDYPEYSKFLVKTRGVPVGLKRPLCQGPVAVKDNRPLEIDLANLRAAVERHRPAESFMNAASPGVVAVFMRNAYYPTHDAYLAALAEVMRLEYESIVAAGFVLQIDAPDMAMGRHILWQDESDESFRRIAAQQIEALNAATGGIAPERMRMHVCWGNYQGPHHCDIPFARIADIVFRARPQALVIEGANPRHEHEWEVYRTAKLPDDKVIIPGVIDSTSNFIEHPELIAQRIRRYADVVGRERVIAGADCGFSTFAGFPQVTPRIAWAKLRSLAEGARLASQQLWSRR
ncbi:MAG: cobalamin-independent methionine synthase II family protein [Alphaproteobacteria bacterium]|nr:cobalamin-independent methionine synthase II family protein [Alphaproteobacteria bacterium]